MFTFKMIFILFIITAELQPKIDSLKNLIKNNPQLNLILELNNLYRLSAKFDSGNIVLKEYEKNARPEQRPYLIYNIGENSLFAGKILEAREKYLETVARFSKSEIANEALERLYLIEIGQKDTTLLKRLAKSICLFETAQLDIAEDSLKGLLKTSLGDYSYYYLALVYNGKGDLPLALSALGELNKNSPEHKIHKATFLAAEINLALGNKKNAQKILEDLIIIEPNSIYGVRAREMLKDISH